MTLAQAIFNLYPQVVVIRGNEAFDAENNQIFYDESLVKNLIEKNSYKEKRANEYPDFRDYLDGIVKNDQNQIQEYINACLAIKEKYPKS